jgi:hypothetical protein
MGWHKDLNFARLPLLMRLVCLVPPNILIFDTEFGISQTHTHPECNALRRTTGMTDDLLHLILSATEKSAYALRDHLQNK